MSIYEGTSNVVTNYQTAEQGKFIQLTDTNFPAISVTRSYYPDQTQAFPGNYGVPSITSVDIYPKYAVLSHITNPSDIIATVTVNSPIINFNTAPLTAIETNIYNAITTGTNPTLSNIFTAVCAVDLNTFDTVTAVNMFNQNFNTAITQLTSVSIANEPETLLSFNNFDINSARGFTVSDTKIPVLAVRVKPNTTRNIRIDGYEIVNTTTGTAFGYTWYESPSAIGGAFTWNDINSVAQYAIFTDDYGSNVPNTFSGGIKRHSGIISGRNSGSEDEMSVVALSGGANPNVMLLAAQRLDAGANNDFWFAVTVKDLGA